MLGDYTAGTASLGVDVLENRFVKGTDGIWRIREMRVFPIMATDYYQGWAKSRLVTPPVIGPFAPDKPVPAADMEIDMGSPPAAENMKASSSPPMLPLISSKSCP